MTYRFVNRFRRLINILCEEIFLAYPKINKLISALKMRMNGIIMNNLILKNCNNIDSATIQLANDYLNIKFASNGTGKSTIAKALELNAQEGGILDELLPFKFLGNSILDEDKPELLGADGIKSVSVFNDTYVDQFVFQQDEILTNSFEIFVQNDEYNQRHIEIEAMLSGIREAFEENADIDAMISDLSILVSGFGKETKKSSYSAASPIGKGIAKGNKIENIPIELENYSDFLVSKDNVKWIKWQLSGSQFLDISDDCPYCTSPSKEKKENIKLLGKEFDAKSIEHINKIVDVLDELSKYFTPEANSKLRAITTNKAEISEEEHNYLGSIRKQAETLIGKLSALKSISYFELKDDVNISTKITALKMNMSYLPELASEATNEVVAKLNSKLDEVILKIGELQGSINKHKAKIQKTIESNSDDINEFLQDAGIKYRVSVYEDAELKSYKMKLTHEDLSDSLKHGKQHLSFGERNAFALVLFMHEALKNNPDLVILDDPISSFDHTKKFAIIKRLFTTANSFQNRTVLLMTHDFEPVIDAIYTMSDRFENVQAHFLSNDLGIVSEEEITKSDILSFPQVCKKVLSSTASIVIKIIYLRRYFEIIDHKALEYNLISSLLKKKSSPTIKGNGQQHTEMTAAEIASTSEAICNHCAGFDYLDILAMLKDDDKMISLYRESESNYAKLQVFRILGVPLEGNAILMKHINETYHIENEYIMQVDPNKYQVVPDFVILECTKAVDKLAE